MENQYLDIAQMYVRFNQVCLELYQKKTQAILDKEVMAKLNRNNEFFAKTLVEMLNIGVPNEIISAWFEVLLPNIEKITVDVPRSKLDEMQSYSKYSFDQEYMPKINFIDKINNCVATGLDFCQSYHQNFKTLDEKFSLYKALTPTGSSNEENMQSAKNRIKI